MFDERVGTLIIYGRLQKFLVLIFGNNEHGWRPRGDLGCYVCGFFQVPLIQRPMSYIAQN